ncbi:hypothetical protein HHI36_019928 [Cryptolaemus montrouzieri]|uniref:Uncharacterized protein n=1 Tax=Cryptolaemus montrouzieri TaxID=559131 RepID=A0ABD2N9D8_9CUCU
METRSGTAEVIFLVGNTSKKIDGNKLPSNREVLKVFFHALRREKGSTIRSSATKAIQLVEEFWQKARIPVKRTQKSIEKLESIYRNWEKIAKNETRRTPRQIEKERLFVEPLDNLFDIAHNDADKLITIEEDKQFLKAQRQKGRIGYMGSVDVSLAQKEARIELRRLEEENRHEKAVEEIDTLGKY